jgi:hypothetical protein
VITSRESDAYREQLARWCRALAAGRIEELSAALAEGEAHDVQRFLAQANGALIDTYVRRVPQRAYDPECSDRERFVRWLQEERPQTPKERQFVAYQQAEYAVAAQARKRRAEHLAFQRAWHLVGTKMERLTRDPALRIQLNPIRVWSWLALPGRVAGNVLFFAAGDRVASATPGPLERAFVEVLARGPCTLAASAVELGPASREELVSLCRGRAAEGLVAFE